MIENKYLGAMKSLFLQDQIFLPSDVFKDKKNALLFQPHLSKMWTESITASAIYPIVVFYTYLSWNNSAFLIV